MGGKTSRILSYEEAAQRLTEDERQHLLECFRRYGRNHTAASASAPLAAVLASPGSIPAYLSVASKEAMDKSVFLRHVVEEIAPEMYLEPFYGAWGGDSLEISLKDALVGFVVLLRNDTLLRKKFLFMMLDWYGYDSLTLRSFEAMLLPSEHPSPQCLRTFFSQNERMDLKAFISFVDENKTAISLFEWIFSPPPTNPKLINAPTYHETIARITNFSSLEEVRVIERRFWDMQTRSMRCDARAICVALEPFLPYHVSSRLFFMFDLNGDKALDFQELMRGLALICKSRLEDALEFAFKFFDIDADGALSERELQGLVSVVHPSPPTSQSSDQTQSPARTRSFSLTVQRSSEKISKVVDSEDGLGTEKAGDESEEEEIVVPSPDTPFSISDSRACIEALDAVRTSLDSPLMRVSLAAFKENPELVKCATLFLRKLKETFMLALGVHPSSHAEEAEAIRNLRNSERAQRIHSTPGEAGYLLSFAWLAKWKLYVGYDAGASAQGTGLSTSSVASSTASSAFATPSATPTKLGSTPQSSGTRSLRSSPHPGSAATSHTTSSQSAPILHPHPGPIQNDPLIHVPGMIEKVLTQSQRWGPSVRSNLVKDRDYVYASEALWTAFSLWYGGGPELPRPTMRVLENGVERIEVELSPFAFRIMKHITQKDKGGQSSSDGSGSSSSAKLPPAYMFFTLECSRTQTIAELAKMVCQQQSKQPKGRANLKLDDMRIWDYRKSSKPVLLEDDTLTVEQARLDDGQPILLEIRNLDLSWPSELFLVAKAQEELADGGDVDTGSAFSKNRQPGTTGISNLGNTCFMNSSLQCLSHTLPLTEYFGQNAHHTEINVANPLGTKGHLASHYGDIVKKLWSGKASVAPVKFRRAIQRFAPQFSGNQQHDSQELLSFLLDGLHEDLNRVTVKPYVERKDSDGRPDHIVARESWESHVQRNKSVIVDLFHGLLKSQLRCLKCHFVSVTFDPFTFLTLPLPTQSSTFVEVRLVRLDGSTPVRYGVQVSSDATYTALKDALAKVCELQPQELVFVDAGTLIQRIVVEERQKIRALSGMALTAYQVVPRPAASSSPFDAVEVTPVDTPESPAPDAGALLEDGERAIGDQVGSKNSTNAHETPSPAEASESETLGAATVDSIDTKPSGTVPTEVTGTIQMDAAQAAESAGASSSLASTQGSRSQSTGTLDGLSSTARAGKLGGIGSSSSNSSKAASPYANRIGTLNGRGGSSAFGASSARMSFVPVRSLEGHLSITHRKLVKQEMHFLVAPLRPVLFGSPLLVPYEQDKTTWKELYERIWRMVRRLVVEDQRRLIDEGSLPHPFELKLTNSSGLSCAECRWFQGCMGCKRGPSDAVVEIGSSELVVMDWDLTTLHLHFSQAESRAVTDHSSLEEWRRSAEKPITLEDCLNTFTKEEELGKDELWFCPRCKEHQQAAKKMDIWSLPPFLIIHLKRFQNINGAWVKSHRPVRFPLTDFDPYKFAAPAAQAAVERARELRRATETAEVAAAESATDHSLVIEDELKKDEPELKSEAVERTIFLGAGTGAESSSTDPEEPHNASNTAPGAAAVESDESLDISQVDPHSSFYTDASAPRKFDLFALSSHLGILGGGHYVAFAQDKQNKWHLFNDSSCKEVPPEEVEKEGSHAYMMFYQCRDLDTSKFVPPVQEGVAAPKIDDDYGEDGDRKRDFCTIS